MWRRPRSPPPAQYTTTSPGRPRPPVSDRPLDHHYEQYGRRIENTGAFNAGVQLFKDRRSGVVVVRKKMEVGGGRLGDELGVGHKDWRREMSLLRSLRHPCIVEFMDGYVTENRACMYMEVCDLGSLRDLILNYRRSGAEIPGRFVWHVLESLISVLVYIHTGFRGTEIQSHIRQHGFGPRALWEPVYHSDIKSANVFLKSGRGAFYPAVKLGDFGVGTGNEELDSLTAQDMTDAQEDVFNLGETIQEVCDPSYHPSFPKRGLPHHYHPAFSGLVEYMMDSEPHPSAIEVLLEMEGLLSENTLPPARPLNERAFKRIM